MILTFLAVLASAAVVSFGGPALAQSDSTSQTAAGDYQKLVDRGLAAYAQQRPAEARGLFAQAHALQPGARTLRALGIADLALDNYTFAKDELQAALDERVMPLTAAQRAEVEGLLGWMRSNLGTLQLRITPLDAETKIDGRPVNAPEVLLAPEEHRLMVSAQGFVPQERTVTVTTDRPMKLEISLQRAAAPVVPIASEQTLPRDVPVPVTAPEEGHNSAKLWPWLGGAGAVLLVSGATMFALGMSDKATVEHAQAPVRLSEIEAAHDRVPWLTGVGLTLGVAGVASIGAAGVLLLTHREPRKDVAWQLQVQPTRLSLRGQF